MSGAVQRKLISANFHVDNLLLAFVAGTIHFFHFDVNKGEFGFLANHRPLCLFFDIQSIRMRRNYDTMINIRPLPRVDVCFRF